MGLIISKMYKAMSHQHMYLPLKIVFCAICILVSLSCKNDNPVPQKTVNATVDRSIKRQVIDGFGFFGAQTVWWEANNANLYSDAWARKVIDDLGITIWRNEYYPPATSTQNQDADWNKQKPVVEGLFRIANEYRVPLKFIFTIWTPPADLKCALDANDRPLSGTPHPQGTKNGGTLDPAKYEEFADWIKDGIELYKDLGIDLYAFSPQNEPLFKQPFNSCYYKPINEPVGGYTNMIKNVIPLVKAAYPNVKVFGSENMLEIEAGRDRQWFYNVNLMKDPQALQQVDILAVHGYMDGVSPTSTSRLASLWNTTVNEHMVPTNKPYWMTETSGYKDSWLSSGGKPGALSLAQDIYAALHHGNVSAWVWWQGSSLQAIDDYTLMNGILTGKKYAVSKHFYRFIRPGAQRVACNIPETDGVFGVAFEHTTMDCFTIVLINTNNSIVKLNLAGNSLPTSYQMFLSTAATDDNCREVGAVNANNITLPAQSVVTLVNGNYKE
jgi:O-glycosyl hydrolase